MRPEAAPGGRRQFGGLVGASEAMCATFTLLERAAASDATVLLEGESGTGKEEAARALHDAGPRRDGPFVVVDCASIPRELIESELFGHQRGAFTGAVTSRSGAFEEAAGGTIFLDEIAELPLDVQPKLLRALERREVRRVGANGHLTFDVRVVAATNGDLAALVQGGEFRADVYFRLAVLRIGLPPLRERPEDIPLICAQLLEVLGADPTIAAPLLEPRRLRELSRARWPGNVRELRNHLERCLVFGGHDPALSLESLDGGAGDLILPLREARERMTAAFERRYLASALARHGHNAAAAARAAGVDRAYFHRLLVRRGLRPSPRGGGD